MFHQCCYSSLLPSCEGDAASKKGMSVHVDVRVGALCYKSVEYGGHKCEQVATYLPQLYVAMKGALRKEAYSPVKWTAATRCCKGNTHLSCAFEQAIGVVADAVHLCLALPWFPSGEARLRMEPVQAPFAFEVACYKGQLANRMFLRGGF
eukprot:454692-Pelagomonas_calceolata.AAC.1